MISYSELKKGVRILLKGQPYEILDCAPMFKGRGHSVLQAKIKNLVTKETISWTFRPADNFDEPETSKIELKYLYPHRGSYFFCEKNNPQKRFELPGEKMRKKAEFLKSNQEVSGLFFKGTLIDISLPIKIALKVVEAPPVVKGQSAQAGTKPVTLETGAKINVPLFMKAGDIIEINTETGEYVKRIE